MRPDRELLAGPALAGVIVHRAVGRRVVGREDGVAATRLADAPAPVGRDPVAGLAGAWEQEGARDARLHERDGAERDGAVQR